MCIVGTYLQSYRLKALCGWYITWPTMAIVTELIISSVIISKMFIRLPANLYAIEWLAFLAAATSSNQYETVNKFRSTFDAIRWIRKGSNCQTRPSQRPQTDSRSNSISNIKTLNYWLKFEFKSVLKSIIPREPHESARCSIRNLWTHFDFLFLFSPSATGILCVAGICLTVGLSCFFS